MIVRRLVRLCIRLVIMLLILGGGADCSGDTRLHRRIWMRHGGNEGWCLSWKRKPGLSCREKEHSYEARGRKAGRVGFSHPILA